MKYFNFQIKEMEEDDKENGFTCDNRNEVTKTSHLANIVVQWFLVLEQVEISQSKYNKNICDRSLLTEQRKHTGRQERQNASAIKQRPLLEGVKICGKDSIDFFR